jgi:hypothetical protein
MYVGIVTLNKLHVFNNLLAQKMTTNSVRPRIEVVINTKRNRISVERDMKYHSAKTTI